MPRNTIVYREKGRFAAWPAGYCCWSWGDELLVSFEEGAFKAQEHIHAVDREQDRYTSFARSLDGGETWTSWRSDFAAPCSNHNGPRRPELLKRFEGNIDFANPDFCLLFSMSGLTGDDFSWWHYSLDRGHTWEGPFEIGDMGAGALNTRTMYEVLSPSELLVYMTCAKRDGKEGRVFCCKLKDGGRTFEFLGYVGEELEVGHTIMPAAARRKSGELVCLNRTWTLEGEEKRFTIEQYASADGGRTWARECAAASGTGGNPPSLVVTRDGVWVLIYGVRVEPYGIRAQYSLNEGRTWSVPRALRSDGGFKDLGYVRSALRADGKIVSCYYFCDSRDSERYIAATIFAPEDLK